MAAYVDGEVDQVEIFYNGYISPLTQEVTRETLLPLQQATILEGARTRTRTASEDERRPEQHALVEYEPDPEEILQRLVPDLRRDLDLPRAARVHRVRARRAHDRDAQRVRERRRPHQGPDPADEPRAPGGDHPGDHGSRRRRRRRSRNRRPNMEASTETSRTAEHRDRAQRRPDRGDPGRRDRGRLPRRAARDQLRDHRRARGPPRAEDDETSAATSSARCSSTSATTASARSPWTPPTASRAAPR